MDFSLDKLDDLIYLINERTIYKKDVAKELNMRDSELAEVIKANGYKWDMKEQKYLKVEMEAIDEIASTIEEDKNTVVESDDEMLLAIDEIVNSIGKKDEYIRTTTHIRSDIVEALNKFADGKARGAKQEFINKVLELALKRTNFL